MRPEPVRGVSQGSPGSGEGTSRVAPPRPRPLSPVARSVPRAPESAQTKAARAGPGGSALEKRFILPISGGGNWISGVTGFAAAGKGRSWDSKPDPF